MVLNEKMVKKHLNALSKRYPSKGLSRNVLITFYLFHGSTTIGATAAIVTVHVILAGFVYKAIKEPAAELELKEE